MKLVITIDVEEDNWGEYRVNECTVANLKQIPKLQHLFDEYGVKPTYLINYPVATDPWSIDMLSDYVSQGKCEIGMHCHPWNTPPYDDGPANYTHNHMLCNLPLELQHLKMAFLHNVICKNFGIVPVSFRAGRWGFGPTVARSLLSLGYRIDTTVTPYKSWTASKGPDFSSYGPEPFMFNAESYSSEDDKGLLLEVPATIGFIQSDFRRSYRLMKLAESQLARKFRLLGVLDRIGLLNKVWLSPELASSDLMIGLSRSMQANNYPCLNMTFHSTSLLAGLSPFVRTKEDEQDFFRRIKAFIVAACQSGLESRTLVEFEADLKISVPEVAEGPRYLCEATKTQ